MSELRDVVAAVLEEHRRKAPRVQARLVLEAIDGKPRRPLPKAAQCEVCASWDAAVTDPDARVTAIEVAAAKGREVPLLHFAFSEIDRLFARLDRAGRRTG